MVLKACGAMALVALLQAAGATAHIFFQCPSARSCFYGGSGFDTDTDGAWRREPCDRVAIAPTTVVGSGDDMCLEIQEFVPHPGFFSISIFDGAVNPGDAEPAWTVLEANIPQTTDGTTTGFQRFTITIPEDLTCEHCTIQVRQYAEDFDWYYTACTDVEVVSNTSTAISTDACWDQPEAECTFSEGPARIRVKILQQIVVGSYVLVVAMGGVAFCLRVRRASKRSLAQAVVSPKSVSDSDATCWSGFKEEANMPRHVAFLKWLAAASVVGAVGLAVTFVGLKNCWGS